MELNDLLKKDVMEAVTKNLTSIQVQQSSKFCLKMTNSKSRTKNRKMDC